MEKYLVISERQKDLPRGLNFYCSSHLILHNSFPGVVPNFFEKERIFFILKPAKFFFLFFFFQWVMWSCFWHIWYYEEIVIWFQIPLNWKYMSSTCKNSHFRTVTPEILHLLETRYSQLCDYHSTGINKVVVATSRLLGLKNLHKFFWKEVPLHESPPCMFFWLEYQ